jgi:hypothetical protein
MIDKALRGNCEECFGKQNWYTNGTEFMKREHRSVVLQIHDLLVIVCYVKIVLLLQGIGAIKVLVYQ